MSNLVPGITLIHEHTTIDLSKVKQNDDCFLNCYEETVQEYKDLYDLGVRNIVDVTALGMGRNMEYVLKAAKESGINIICATGFYKEPFLPEMAHTDSIEQLADWMIKELNRGIEDTGIKAGLIGEIGTSEDAFLPEEVKVFESAVLAHKKTNCVISTHTSLSTMAKEQAHFFLERNVNPNKVIIGHQDLKCDLEQISFLIDHGFYVGFDTIGKNNYYPDEKRAEALKFLQDTNRIHRVCLSLDITRKSNMKYKGGIGYSYLFTDFIPLLLKAGVTQKSIDQMLIENPQRLFNGD